MNEKNTNPFLDGMSDTYISELQLRKNKRQEENKKSKKKNWIIGGVVGGIIVLVMVFIFAKSSPIAKANIEVEEATTADELKEIWKSNKKELSPTYQKQLDTKIRKKIESLHLKPKEILGCKQWLGAAKMGYNILIVPDLSSRIHTSVDKNGKQARRDTSVISMLWDEMNALLTDRNLSKNNRLVVDVTDPNQAVGIDINSLQFNTEKSTNPYRDMKAKKKEFMQKIGELYANGSKAKIGTAGADYVSYVDNISTGLTSQLRNADIYNDYTNIVIFLTDGYIEATQPDGRITNYTPINGTTPIPIPEETDLTNVKVIVAEMDELSNNNRPSIRGTYYKQLRNYWVEYLEGMNAIVDKKHFLQNDAELQNVQRILKKVVNGKE